MNAVSTAESQIPAVSTPGASLGINPWRILAWLGIAIMEATWLALTFNALSIQAGAIPIASIFAAVIWLLTTYYLSEYRLVRFDLGRWPERIAQLIIFSVATIPPAWIIFRFANAASPTPLALLRFVEEFTALLPIEVLFALFSAFVYWRGAALARQGVGTFAVIRHLKFGIAAFLIYSLLALSQDLDLPGFEFFMLFMFGSLLALSSARVSVLGRFRGGRRSPFNRGWVGSMAFAISGTMGIGVSIAMLFTGRLFTFWRQLFTLLLGGLVGLIMAPFIFLISLFSDSQVDAFVAPTPTPLPRFLSPFEEDAGFIPNFVDSTGGTSMQAPDFLQPIIYFGSVTLAILFLLVVIWRAAYAMRQRQASAKFEYAIPPRDWLAYLRRTRQRANSEPLIPSGKVLGQRQRLRAAAKVRQIYMDLMNTFEAVGSPRQKANTPLEFLPRMQSALRSMSVELDLITNAYLKVRYGELPESQNEIQAVDQAWSRVRQAATPLIERHELERKAAERARKRREQVAG